jgi:hypothetical protein
MVANGGDLWFSAVSSSETYSETISTSNTDGRLGRSLAAACGGVASRLCHPLARVHLNLVAHHLCSYVASYGFMWQAALL